MLIEQSAFIKVCASHHGEPKNYDFSFFLYLLFINYLFILFIYFPTLHISFLRLLIESSAFNKVYASHTR